MLKINGSRLLHSLTPNSFPVPVLLSRFGTRLFLVVFLIVFQFFDFKFPFHQGHMHLSIQKIFFLDQWFIYYSIFSSMVAVDDGTQGEHFVLATACHLFLFYFQAATSLDENYIYPLQYILVLFFLVSVLDIFPINLSNFLLYLLLFCLHNYLWQIDAKCLPPVLFTQRNKNPCAPNNNKTQPNFFKIIFSTDLLLGLKFQWPLFKY